MIVNRRTRQLDNLVWQAYSGLDPSGTIRVCDHTGCDAWIENKRFLWDDYLPQMLATGWTREPPTWHTEIWHDFCPEHIESLCLEIGIEDAEARDGKITTFYQCKQCPWNSFGRRPTKDDEWDGIAYSDKVSAEHIASAPARVRWRKAQIAAWQRGGKYVEQQDFINV